jgi:predicted acetyltransferase
MVRLAENTERQQVWDMWKSCFGDPDNYMELYFRDKYRPGNTLLYMDGAKAAASLQMLHYRFTFHGAEIPVIYLSGICTLPVYRRKGYTRALLIEGFREAVRREVSLMFLVPQEKWLVELYAKYGFALTFDAGTRDLPSLKELVARHRGNMEAAYHEFDRHFRGQDMTVQKTFDDFKTIVEEGALFDFPVKRSLVGMARVIDAGWLLSEFASRNNEVSFNIRVRDELLEHNNRAWAVSGGRTAGETLPGVPDVHVDIDDLARLLLGYHTATEKAPYPGLFPEKTPMMHFMLE